MADRRKQILKSRKFAKSKKKNWGKHCDISEIEDWLDDRRKQEASGLKPASERTNEELFHIDQDKSIPTLSKPTKSFKNLKSERYAYPDTTIPPILPAPVKKRNLGSTHMDTNEQADSSDEDSYPRELLYHKRTGVLADTVRGRKFAMVQQKIVTERIKDIWSDKVDVQYKPVKRPGAHSGPRVSMPLPHPGTSYNPQYTDHQRLLKKALKVEEIKKETEDRLKRTFVLPKMSSAQIDKQWQIEMQEGIWRGEKEEEEEREGGEEREVMVVPKRPIKATNRKTLKQRRRERLARIALKNKKRVYNERVTMDEVFRIRSLKKEIRHKIETADSAGRRRLEQRMKRDLKRTKRLGKHPYVQPPIDVKLSDEIVGSLRLLQAEGNNSRDQYSSILKRNVIAPKGPRLPTRLHKHKPRVRWVVSRAYDLRPDQLK